MFTRVLATIDDMSQCQEVLGLVSNVAVEGVTEVRALHLRLREVAGYNWRPLETSDQASFHAEAATFELRMAGFSAGGVVRHAPVDRVAQAILREAKAFDAQLIVLGSPRRGELLARVFGSVTHRVIQRSTCPVIVAPRRTRISPDPVASATSPG
ncbi:MAG: universal stress protein [Nocardiopsaceae bacterium]|jgi:nucleotide-binding universal stress UspA family protein|nr:universal stress protein [Nocardiopsaceae bacterium]